MTVTETLSEPCAPRINLEGERSQRLMALASWSLKVGDGPRLYAPRGSGRGVRDQVAALTNAPGRAGIDQHAGVA